MMKRYFLVLTVCLSVSKILNAQVLEKAQKQMDKYNFSGAIELLIPASLDDKLKSEAMPMLAECYRMQHDIANTKATYARLVAMPQARPEYFYYYALSLQSTGEYAKAREMFQKYSEKNPSDPRGKIFSTACDSVLGPWKNLTPEYEIKTVDKINTNQSDFGPAVYEGNLVFASDFNDNPGEGKEYGWTGRGFLNIMKSSPLENGDFWGSMGNSTEFGEKFNQEYHDGPAAFAADGKSIYFTRSFIGKAKREGIYKTNLLKIYFATRNGEKWGEITPFFLNSTDYSVGHPSLSADGKTLYFISDMPGGQGNTDIWMCKRENDSWGNPVNLGPAVNTTENEMFPTISEDNVLYFSSDGHAGYGALDIFKTTNANGQWTTPVNLKEPFNSSYDDFAMAFLSGTRSGFFSSNRPGGAGNDDIYTFRVRELPVLPSFISGFVKDKTNMQPIAGATVFLLNPTTGKVKIIKTGVDGMYKAQVENPAEYIVKAMMTSFIADCIKFPITELKSGSVSMAPRDLLLDKLLVNKTFRIDNIYYDFDKFNIREDAKPELDKLVRIMNENAISVELGSHTDCRGSIAYNDKLSQNRAESAVKYIISAGIDKSRITAKGYGEHQLVNKCADGVDCSPEDHQANRRTEFKVTGFSEPSAKVDPFDESKYLDGQEIELSLLPSGFYSTCK